MAGVLFASVKRWLSGLDLFNPVSGPLEVLFSFYLSGGGNAVPLTPTLALPPFLLLSSLELVVLDTYCTPASLFPLQTS